MGQLRISVRVADGASCFIRAARAARFGERTIVPEEVRQGVPVQLRLAGGVAEWRDVELRNWPGSKNDVSLPSVPETSGF